jgi:hypothetical protein
LGVRFCYGHVRCQKQFSAHKRKKARKINNLRSHGAAKTVALQWLTGSTESALTQAFGGSNPSGAAIPPKARFGGFLLSTAGECA